MKFILDNKVAEFGRLNDDYTFIVGIIGDKKSLTEQTLVQISDKIEKRMFELLKVKVAHPNQKLKRRKTVVIKNEIFELDLNISNHKRVLFLSYIYSLCLEAKNSQRMLRIEI